MAVAKTKEQIINDMVGFLANLDQSLDVTVGSPIRDIIIEAVADELFDLYREADAISNKQNVSNPSILSLSEVIDYGRNFGIERNQGSKSTVTVYFETSVEPTADIVIPAGTKVSTLADSLNGVAAVQFETIEAKLLPFNARDTFINSSTDTWRIGVLCQAVSNGANGNVSSETIKILVDSITGIETVLNDAAALGGTDAETKNSLAQRIINTYTGGDKSTVPGIFNIVAEVDGVLNTRVVGPDSVYMTRNGLLGNAVDVYIRGTDLETKSNESFVYSSDTPTHIFEEQPVDSVNSLVDTNGVTYVEGVDFQIVKDTGGFAGSRIGQDYIAFISGKAPAENTILAVSYNYNALIKQLQNLFIEEDNVIINLDILIKEVTAISIIIDIDVSLTSGVQSSQALPYLESLISSHISSLNIGDPINQSDIINILESAQVGGTNAITKVYLPLIEFRRGDQGSGTAADIVIGDFEYPIAASINVDTR